MASWIELEARLEIPFHITARLPEGQRYRYEEQESRTQEMHKSGVAGLVGGHFSAIILGFS